MQDSPLEHGEYQPEKTPHTICILANNIELPANISFI